eukprot:4830349-Pyramimonas_sp.AAC.1
MTKLAVEALGGDIRGAVQAGWIDLRKGQEEEAVRGAAVEFEANWRCRAVPSDSGTRSPLQL